MRTKIGYRAMGDFGRGYQNFGNLEEERINEAQPAMVKFDGSDEFFEEEAERALAEHSDIDAFNYAMTNRGGDVSPEEIQEAKLDAEVQTAQHTTKSVSDVVTATKKEPNKKLLWGLAAGAAALWYFSGDE